MHSFKKCLVSLLVFCLILSTFSAVIIYIFLNTESAPYQDIVLRNKLAGTIDTLLLGSSEGQVAFKSTLIDEELGVKSYNLCGSACPPSGIKALLEEEIDRNPLKTVIIDIGSFLHYDYTDSVSEGEIKVIPRLSNNSKKLKYMFENVWINNYSYLYATYMNNGISTLKNLIFGSYIPVVTGKTEMNLITTDEEAAVKDLSLNNTEILKNYVQDKTTDEKDFFGKIELKNYELLKEMIKMCKSRNIQVVLVFIPATESRIWTNGNFETEKEFYYSFAKDYNCIYLDFNLMKEKGKYLSDKTSFKDHFHLSESGSKVFTKCLCNVLIKIRSGEDISDMFYDSYDEAIKHFEYYEIYQSMLKEQN